ncbi:hypothetical protein AAFN88_08715 [Pelagibius sp. CAU 1746]|uniref:hypothetical protein n=1 Tax=Pelagibius sp. CAU 1746 TaxID=3140370 RepID=UPI00325BE31D
METTFTPTLFTPGEAEGITGVSTALQRDWRRRGFLPSNDGHARFDVFALAEMWALRLLAERGIGPQQSRKAAAWLAAGIVHEALQHRQAYEGDFEAAALRGAHPDDNVQDRLDVLARWIVQERSRPRGAGQVLPARFFVWTGDGKRRWVDSVDAWFDDIDGGRRKGAGAVIVMDQRALGRRLLDLARRPFVHVEEGEAE